MMRVPPTLLLSIRRDETTETSSTFMRLDFPLIFADMDEDIT
jgi:hypothetical protein